MDAESLAGKLLIAMPGIGDSRFEKAVILLCMHTPEAAMGLIINKLKSDIVLGDVLEHLGVDAPDPVQAKTVLDGGPVKPDRGYVVHTRDFDAGEATQIVTERLRLTATREILEVLGDDAQAPQRFVLALGYAGWGPGQLETEILKNAWLVSEPDEDIVFGDGHDKKWVRAIRTLGIDPTMLSSTAGRA
jgi:putative transcriptional regulator